MLVEEDDVREICTEAVFERGEEYWQNGRIQRLDRYGDVLTAVVEGRQLYDVTVDLAEPAFAPACTCPYTGPGECKHVVAVLLAVAADPPEDQSGRIESILEDVTATDLRSFVETVIARNPKIREQFLAEFGESSEKSAREYRAEIDQLFDEHTDEYPVVVEAIDFSHYTELAEQYRDKQQYVEALKIYRGLAEGIEKNMNLVDAAYDHYAQTFQHALDGYVACISAAEFSESERQQYIEFLSERASGAVDHLAARYQNALAELQQ